MKKVVFSFFYTVFCIPLFAQLGYWHHSKFLELTPLNDSVYYLNFNKVTSDKKHKLIAESGFVRTLAKFSLMPRDRSLTYRSLAYSTLPPSLPQAGLKVFISSKPRLVRKR